MIPAIASPVAHGSEKVKSWREKLKADGHSFYHIHLDPNAAKSFRLRCAELRYNGQEGFEEAVRLFSETEMAPKMDPVRLKAPILLIESSTSCYRCSARIPVVAIGCSELAEYDPKSKSWGEFNKYEEPAILSNVETLPVALVIKITRFHPHFAHRFSSKVGRKYWMNVCPHCSAHQGDFFLHAEAGAAFAPMDSSAAAALIVRELDFKGIAEVSAAGISVNGGRLISDYAKRL